VLLLLLELLLSHSLSEEDAVIDRTEHGVARDRFGQSVAAPQSGSELTGNLAAALGPDPAAAPDIIGQGPRQL
jgi:hypothetical protein